jgi:hypothetical protein
MQRAWPKNMSKFTGNYRMPYLHQEEVEDAAQLQKARSDEFDSGTISAPE